MKKLSPRVQAFLAQQGIDLQHLKAKPGANPKPQSSAITPKPEQEDIHPHLKPAVDPQQIVQDTLKAVRHTELREFLEAVFTETEVHQILTTRHNAQGYYQRYAIQYLRAAAAAASFWSAQGWPHREVMYVATLMQGIRQLLAPCIVGGASVDDVMFTIVRTALYQLDDHAPQQASLLRLCLGWGNADEIDGCYIPQLQQIVQQALERAGQREHTLTTLTKPRLS
ncbi:hypothetical protein GCM10027399_14360 [Curvibacter fontanus]